MSKGVWQKKRDPLISFRFDGPSFMLGAAILAQQTGKAPWWWIAIAVALLFFRGGTYWVWEKTFEEPKP